MVGYYNTLPFLYGLEQNNNFEVILDIPSKCIDYYDSHQANIALVPIATLIERTDYKIITDYCIGCDGTVRTVSLCANSEMQSIKKIYLDEDSRTSQQLVKFLCHRYWNIEVKYEQVNVRLLKAEDVKENEAVLMIGDKVFELESSYTRNYDLGEEWKKFTGLSFPFAVWITRKDTEDQSIGMLNEALKIGVENIDRVLDKNKTLATKIELSDYFKRYIDFRFDRKKKEALELFFEFSRQEIINVD